jgi:hypothetical protein
MKLARKLLVWALPLPNFIEIHTFKYEVCAIKKEKESEMLARNRRTYNTSALFSRRGTKYVRRD